VEAQTAQKPKNHTYCSNSAAYSYKLLPKKLAAAKIYKILDHCKIVICMQNIHES